MSSPVITVAPTASLVEICKLLTKHRISSLLVGDKDEKLLGLVTEADVLKSFRESLRRRREAWLELIAEGEELLQEFLTYLSQVSHTAAEVMERNVITGAEDMTIPEIAERATKHRIKRLPDS